MDSCALWNFSSSVSSGAAVATTSGSGLAAAGASGLLCWAESWKLRLDPCGTGSRLLSRGFLSRGFLPDGTGSWGSVWVRPLPPRPRPLPRPRAASPG
eukprot:CAMPEP_0201093746 /NCGR_PEP_ID=MMETSP0812-20130820/2183_1 /ASSEMBLY_ACC=CAM_ASM_000668 /TAXON_ID=98059 /ORGANISM="Dinobryon sp., Strain UTEXLB2267" /LENGTH=97 /DNA_ID=CAMNT_0047346029 /DNA_START=97 /DNA_END=386 /DNA_ORIENTATION=-